MKIIRTYQSSLVISLALFSIISCNNPNTNDRKLLDAKIQLEKDLEKYENVWNSFLNGDTTVVNKDNFHNDVIVVTNEGNLIGIEAIKNFYMNYLNGFSNIEFTIIDAFGQGDKIVKHWNFKGIHTGLFFGIPATGNKLDLSGTTLVEMKNGKIAKEQDFLICSP